MSPPLPPYPTYKPSCSEWLGDVPAHWEIQPLKHWVGMNTRVLPEATDPSFDFRYLEIGAISDGIRIEEPRRIRFADAPSRARRMVESGDTIVSTVRPYLKAVWFADDTYKDLVCSTGFAVLSPRWGTVPKYVGYMVQSSSFTNQMTADSVGTAYPAISEGKFGSLQVCVPPLPEQHAIARYLDHVDRRIQRYIDTKEKLIALLQEARQATIQRAVTRGLDPNVPLKPSGVDWLGDVPAHWEVRRTKFLYREVNERSSTGEEELMSVSHKTGVTPRKESVTMFRAESNIGYKVCRPGDIVVNTMWAYMAALGVARQVGLVSPSYNVYRPINRVQLCPEYVDPLLRTEAYRTEYLIRSTGITVSRLRLYPDSFLDIPLLYLPVEEQSAIATRLDKATVDIDAAVDSARRQVELMREYRASLIAHVVTGKLDVRAAPAEQFGMKSAQP